MEELTDLDRVALRKLQLEREIAAFNARVAGSNNGATPSGETVTGEVVTPPSNGLELIVKGVGFECRRVGTSWQMMQFSKAQQAASITIPKGLPEDSPRRKELEEKRNEAGMRMLSALFDTAMVLLKPHERDRFREFMDAESMSEDGIKPGELEEAIGNVIAAAAGEQGKAGMGIQAPSSDSSQTTSMSVAPGLLDKGTDRVSVHDVS